MRKNNTISYVLTGFLVLCAMMIVGLIVKMEFFPPESYSQEYIIEDWDQLQFNGYRVGPKDAPVQFVKFFDYQCKYCKQVQISLHRLQQRYSEKVVIIHQHFPLPGHLNAYKAALATECARMQDAFLGSHRFMYSNQDVLGNDANKQLANSEIIDNTDAFINCIENEETAEIVNSSIEIGVQLGINAVPAFLINHRLVIGALSESQLEVLIEKTISDTSK